MTGYLQRMVAGAQSPGGDIHPILRSLHSPAPPRTAASPAPGDLFASDETSEAAPAFQPARRAQQPLFAPESSGARPDLAPFASTIPRPSAAPLNEEEETRPVSVDLSPLHPRLSHAAPEQDAVERVGGSNSSLPEKQDVATRLPQLSVPAERLRSVAGNSSGLPVADASEATSTQEFSTARTQRAIERPYESQRKPLDESAIQPATEASRVMRPHADRKPDYTPLVTPPGQSSGPPPFSLDSMHARVQDSRRELRSRAPEARALSRREPDEIRIHIGRIEVTAAAPPPVRAEPKPVSNSPSLDDYLKRSKGRG